MILLYVIDSNGEPGGTRNRYTLLDRVSYEEREQAKPTNTASSDRNRDVTATLPPWRSWTRS